MTVEARRTVGAYLFTQSGVNERLNSVAREELNRRGITYKELDLTGLELDEDWQSLPVIDSKAGFAGGFEDPGAIQEHVSFIKSLMYQI